MARHHGALRQVPGLSFLEPKRHIPHIEDLDGPEAQTFGVVLAGVTRALKDATGAERVYVHVFGSGSPHLHVHLEPHLAGRLSTNLVSDEKTGGAGGKEADRQYVAELIRHHLVDMGDPALA